PGRWERTEGEGGWTAKEHETKKWTQGEGCPQAKKKVLKKTQPCQHLDLGLLASRTVRKLICCLTHPVCGILLWQPKLRQSPFRGVVGIK
uniref:Uncharacterized protein n=1 Tax=Mustela putorius furo TaxID=9669 RepID=M3XYF3_MUSPF